LPCVTADGKPTVSAKQILEALRARALTPEELSETTHLPLFRIRSSLREIVQVGWVSESQGRYQATQEGIDKSA
jgi:DNA-binding IclR family transcriptional regulator